MSRQFLKAISQGLKVSDIKVSSLQGIRHQGIKVSWFFSRDDLKILPGNDLDSNPDSR